MEKAGLEMRPGDVFECRGGDYSSAAKDVLNTTTGMDVATGGSSSGGYVTFQSAPGEEAIFDGPFKFYDTHRYIRFRDVSWKVSTKAMVFARNVVENFIFENVRFTATGAVTSHPGIYLVGSKRVAFIDCQFGRYYNSDDPFDEDDKKNKGRSPRRSRRRARAPKKRR